METAHTLIAPDGVPLAYRRWHAPGDGTRPPLVLIHGAASNMTRWTEFVEQTTLRESRDLLRLDLRGHSRARYRGHLGLEIWADDLARILDQEQIGRAIIGGHCLGANVAALFSLRHPQHTAGLVLVEPMLRPALTGTLRRLIPLTPLLRLSIAIVLFLNRLGLRRHNLQYLDLQALDRDFRARLAGPGGGDALVRRYASPRQDLKIMPSANFLQDLVEVTRPLPLQRIRAPVLVLLSTGRTFADPDRTRQSLATLPQATVRLLEAKHWIPTEQPVAMRHAIEAWCDRLSQDHNLT